MAGYGRPRDSQRARVNEWLRGVIPVEWWTSTSRDDLQSFTDRVLAEIDGPVVYVQAGRSWDYPVPGRFERVVSVGAGKVVSRSKGNLLYQLGYDLVRYGYLRDGVAWHGPEFCRLIVMMLGTRTARKLGAPAVVDIHRAARVHKVKIGPEVTIPDLLTARTVRKRLIVSGSTVHNFGQPVQGTTRLVTFP